MTSSQTHPTMPSQRPFFLSTFFAALRQQAPSGLSQQPNKSASTSTNYQPSSSAGTGPRAISSSANNASAATSSSPGTSSATSPAPTASRTSSSGGVVSQLPIHSPRTHHHHHNRHHHHPGAIPIPQSQQGRRRGSDSSSEGFREVLGADKWYIGGRTAGGEEKFFKLGVVRRVRSGDRLSLDRLSL